MIVDYQPVQTVHSSLNSIAQINAKDVMNICSSQEEISVKLLPAAATDEMLVEAARLGDEPTNLSRTAEKSPVCRDRGAHC